MLRVKSDAETAASEHLAVGARCARRAPQLVQIPPPGWHAEHFRAIGLGRCVREETEETRVSPEDQAERDEQVEQALTGSS